MSVVDNFVADSATFWEVGVAGNVVEEVFESFVIILELHEVLCGKFVERDTCTIWAIPVLSMESRLFVNIFS